MRCLDSNINGWDSWAHGSFSLFCRVTQLSEGKLNHSILPNTMKLGFICLSVEATLTAATADARFGLSPAQHWLYADGISALRILADPPDRASPLPCVFAMGGFDPLARTPCL
jgi:hypothetical protein